MSGFSIDYIRGRVSAIEASTGDPEAAHGLEDELHKDFIRYVAENGTGKLRQMATEVLKTNSLDFARWCA